MKRCLYFFGCFVLVVNVTLIRGQPTTSIVNDGDKCLQSCPKVQQQLFEMKERIHENERRYQEKCEELTVMKEQIAELMEWKKKQSNEGNEIQTNSTDHENEAGTIKRSRDGFKEHYIGFIKNYDTSANNVLLISSKNATSVQIFCKVPFYNRTYNIGANGFVRVEDIPVEVRVISNDTVTQQGVLVTATEDIWVQGGNRGQYTLDGFNTNPIGPDSVEYILVSHITISNGYLAGFVVVGTQDNTLLRVFKLLYGTTGVLVKEITINKLDTYSWYETRHMGSILFKIVTDKPVAVYSGYECGHITSSPGCNHMVSSIPPTPRLGTDYIVPPIAGVPGSAGYLLTIVLNETDTDIFVFKNNALFTKVLQENGYHTMNIHESNETFSVTCSKPCLLSLHANGYTPLKMNPFMMVISPITALSDFVRFGTLTPFGGEFQNIYLTIIAFTTTGVDINMDDKHLQTPWYPIYGWGGGYYYYSVTQIQDGFHRLESKSGGFIAYVQGFNNTDSTKSMAYGSRLSYL